MANYTNKEIIRKLDALTSKLDDNHSETKDELTEIKVQMKDFDGRIKRNKEIADEAKQKAEMGLLGGAVGGGAGFITSLMKIIGVL